MWIPPIELPTLWIAVLNALGIPITHLVIAWLSTRLPSKIFDFPSDCSSGAWIYERLLGIRRWKGLLPDGAVWMKGFSKGKLQSSTPEYLHTFLLETRRGEFSHWIQWLAISLFILWTPSPYHLIILLYAILSNFPCIFNLRYTRVRLTRILTQANTR